MTTLQIKGLKASVAGTEILKGVDLEVSSGEVHAIMGPNGSGKSTLAHVLMGRPGYEVLDGQVLLDGVDILALPTWERARAGLFLALQYPTEVPGVQMRDMLVAAGCTDVESAVTVEAQRTGLDVDLLERPVNVDMSGGEKKRNETVQLGVLRPKIAVLDEIDSGLDIDALRAVASRVEAATTEDQLGVLAITHYNRLLTELHADHVHIMRNGRIIESGGPDLATRVETDGYGDA